MSKSPPIVGIDLGTTNSAIAHVVGEPARPELIFVDGQRICPSVVSFDAAEREPLVGYPARNRLVVAPEETVRSAKRFMGTDHLWRIHGHEFSPQHIQSRILAHLAHAAELATGTRPVRAVITVPAYFDQMQRQATREAGELAGLSVERLLNEPTAAALAYHPEGGVKQILVYDLGGGTFDASLVRMDGTLLEVLASHGDTHLGGDDFDETLAEFVLERFVEMQNENDDEADAIANTIRNDPAAWTRLLLASEAAKIELSAKSETVVRAEFIIEYPKNHPRHIDVPLHREDLLDLIADDLSRTMESVQQVMDDAKVTPADIDEILLVGGSTRIPAVWHMLHERLGKDPNRSIDPDICVAVGASVQAGIIAGLPVGKILVDVAPYSLGVGVLTGMSIYEPWPYMINRVITPRNTPLPSRFAEKFTAVSPDQPRCEAFVFQGSDLDPRKNRCIGKISLDGLRIQAGEDIPSIIVEFGYDLSGQVTVNISNPGSGRKASETLIIDGLGARDMMDEYLKSHAHTGVLPGPPSSAADLLVAQNAPPAKHLATSPNSIGTTENPDDLPDEFADDDRMLRQIMGRFPELEKKHAASAETIRSAIDAARQALHARPVNRQTARRAIDDLTDLLFDLGEFF